MMTKAAFTSVTALLLVTLSLPHIANAAGLSINPPTVAADYSGTIGLTLTGLTVGQTVVVDKFLDLNGNGTVDGTDTLVQHFTVTDGPPPLIGGQRNTNVPGDDDQTANGQIQTMVNFAAQSEANRAIAKYVYRVSTSGGVALASAPFTVTQLSFPQGVMGQVTSGAPVPAVFVALLPSSGNGLIAGTLSDAQGRFTLNSPPGTYFLIALKDGLVFDAATAPSVTINASAFTTQNISLSASDRTISGRLTDAGNAAGIAGVQVSASASSGDHSGAPATLLFTDSAGNFTIPVSTAATQWKLELSGNDAALQGYVPVKKMRVDTTAGDVSNVSVEWTKVSALIYGTLKDNFTHPLPGIEVRADDSTNRYRPSALTNADGSYVIGVLGGNWFVGTNNDDPALAGYTVSGHNVTLSDGQAVAVNLVAQRANSHLQGQVIDEVGAAVGDLSVNACPQNQGAGSCPFASSGADGSFDIAVTAGTWTLFVESNGAAQRGLVGAQIMVTVGDGQTVSGLVLRVVHTTAQITGTVRDSTGNPIANLNVGASATVDGVNFNANSQTDADGNYALAVFNADWNIGLDCQDLSSRGFECPAAQSATVNDDNPVVNITVQGMSCVGDCDGDGAVTVNEIIKMVNIALNIAPVSDCMAGNPNGDSEITIDEIILAVNHALGAC